MRKELDWKQDAVCAQVSGDFWFPDKGQNGGDAKKLCETCPVAEICLKYALEHGERFGIWGGKTERQRRKIEQRMGLTLIPGDGEVEPDEDEEWDAA